MLEKDIAEKVVRGSFTISLNINGRTIQMGGYIQEGETKADLNRRIDEYQEIVDRQLIRADTKSQEGHLKGEMMQLEALVDRYEKAVEKKKRLGKLHSAEEAQLRNHDTNVETLKKSIEVRRTIINENTKALAQL